MVSSKINLEDIEKEILDDSSLPLHENGKLVFGKGNSKADILFVGEAPGREEAESGIPFVGRAGKELDKLLNSIGLSLDDVYIANILKYRPPQNRDPNAEEIKRHTPYLVKQINIIGPKVICTLGNFSTKFVLAGFNPDGMKSIDGVSKLHGMPKTIRVRDHEYTVVPLYHPAAMLYRPQLRQELERDFKRIAELLGLTGGQKGLEEWS